MRISLILFGLMLGISFQGFSQAVPDSTFNNLLRKYNGGWIAGDATFSIALPANKTLWLFGDSFIGTANADSSIAPGASFIRNCGLLQDGDSLRALYGGTFNSPAAFVPSEDPDSTWYWPEHGLIENDTLKIFFSEFKLSTGPAGFNYKYTGAYLTRFTYPAIELVDMTKIPYFDINGVSYGNSVFVENGYTYIYGRKETDTVYHICYPHVARAVAGNITGPWEFFSGTAWVSDPVITHRISMEAVSQQYGVFRLNNKFALITQEIWLSAKINSFTSNFLYGPFYNKKLLYQTPILYTNSFTYNAFPHIQFNNDKLLVSYNTNGNFWDIFGNVEIYRPMFIRVPFTMIDPTYVSAETFEPKTNTEVGIILDQNYPNPADFETKIKFTVTKTLYVNLKIYAIDGKEMRSLVNKVLFPGQYEVEVDLNEFKSGVYCYHILSQSFSFIKK
jgi:hypothetical protein